jgi:uncharacterized protein
MKATKRTWIFLGMTFALSWALCGVAYACGVRLGSPFFPALGMAMMCCPAACAAICTALFPEAGPDGLKPKFGKAFIDNTALNFRIGWKGFVISWLIFPAAIAVAVAVGLLFPGARVDLSNAHAAEYLAKAVSTANAAPAASAETIRKSLEALPVPYVLLIALEGFFAGISINALFAFGEEAGWRGYLTKSLKGSNFWTASLFSGAVWGLWHAPLIIQGYNYPQHPIPGVFLMMVFCVLVGIIQLYIRMRTKSAVATAVAHGSLNAFAGLGAIALVGGSDLTTAFLGASGFIALAAAILAIFLVDRKSKRPVMAMKLGDEYEG